MNDFSLARRDRISIAALADEPFILWPRSLSAVVHDDIIAACRRHGFSPRIAVESAGAAGTLGLVVAGLGVSVLVASYSRLRRAGVAFVPIDGLSSTLSIAWHEDNRSPALPTFLETARAVARELDV